RAASAYGRDQHLHLPRLPDPQRRRPADQFPPARIDPADAGVGVRGPRADPVGLCARGAAALPLLLLRRRDAAARGRVPGLNRTPGLPATRACAEADEYNSDCRAWPAESAPILGVDDAS